MCRWWKDISSRPAWTKVNVPLKVQLSVRIYPAFRSMSCKYRSKVVKEYGILSPRSIVFGKTQQLSCIKTPEVALDLGQC